MTLVEIEGAYINPEMVCIVRIASDQKFQTEVVVDGAQHYFELFPDKVVALLTGAKKVGSK